VIDHELVEAGCIPLHWYDVLIELKEAPQRRLRLNELARKVVLSKSGLTRLVDKLEAAGLLQRQSAAEDGRGAFAVLTDAGYGALRQAWPIYARGIQQHFAQFLSDEEANIISTALTRMVDAKE
jgi:DNA-binding MarR family transcriptional regulator